MSRFWNRNRIVLKSFWIGFLVLLLLIPTFLVDWARERTPRDRKAGGGSAEISSRWAGAQTVTGPVIGIPYLDSSSGGMIGSVTKRWAYFLPEKLRITTRIVPETRYRGIFRVIVYTTELQVNGHFDGLRLQELGLSPDKVLWNEAAIFFDLADLQGLQEEVSLHLNSRAGNADLELVPAKVATDQFKNALGASWSACRWVRGAYQRPNLWTSRRLSG